MEEIYDYDETFISGYKDKSWRAIPDLGMYTDDELLDVPAHILADRIRTAAYDGRSLIIADPVATCDAVSRIPDEEVTAMDYRPFIDWSTQADHPASLPNTYGVNTTLANASIPYRVVEPSLPDKTKVSMYEATAGDVALSAVEKCVVRGQCAIQAVEAAGGNSDQLAEVLNQAWGGIDLFQPDLNVDFLGDVSLARYLAKSTKRRFQLYRNIGWVSLVSAGSNTATGNAYGKNSVVNWQRRTELAMYYIHIAMMMEGKKLTKGDRFSISARIEQYTVQHLSWDVCGLKVDPEEMKRQKIPNSFKDIATNLLTTRLNEFLEQISSIVKHHNTTLDEKVPQATTELATHFDRLNFVRKFISQAVQTEAKAKYKSELALGRPQSSSFHKDVRFKSHDPLTDVMEGLFTQLDHDFSTQLVATTAFLRELSKVGATLTTKERLIVVPHVARYLSRFNYIILKVAESLDLVVRKYDAAQWNRILDSSFPASIRDKNDGIATLRNALAFRLLASTEKDSKATRTVGYNTHRIREILNEGLRSKQQLIVDPQKGIRISIVNDIAEATRETYNNRYRARALAWKIVADYVKRDWVTINARVNSIYWYMMADFTQSVYTIITDDNITLDIRASYRRKALYTAASAIGKAYDEKPPLLKEIPDDKLIETLNNWVATLPEHKPEIKLIRPIFSKAQAHLEQYVKEHGRDFIPDRPAPAVEAPVEAAPVAQIPTISLNEFIKNLSTSMQKTIESTISDLLDIAQYKDAVEPDDVEKLEEYWHEKLDGKKEKLNNWISMYAQVDKRKDAKKIIDGWLERFEEEGEDEEDGREVY